MKFLEVSGNPELPNCTFIKYFLTREEQVARREYKKKLRQEYINQFYKNRTHQKRPEMALKSTFIEEQVQLSFESENQK